MAEVELAQDTLIVHVRGMDQLWALKSRLEILFSHVVGAQADPQELKGGGEASGAVERKYLESSQPAPSTRRVSACSGMCTTPRRR